MYQKIQALMDKKEVTPYKVAKDTKIPQSSFSDWKRGRCKPSLDKLKILAEYFGVPLEELL